MKEIICPFCKTKESDFLNTAMLGCPNCYDSFKKTIEEMLLNIGQGREHKGKTLELSKTEKILLEQYQNLFLEKEKAVIEGRFSDMAKISNKIFELSNELKERGLL